MEDSCSTWKAAASSALFLGSLLQHCRDQLHVLQTMKSDELKNFIKDMKEQTKQISSELKDEAPDVQRWHIRRRSESLLSVVPRTTSNSKLDKAEDVYCGVCQNRFKKVDKQYPCRVCDNIFHKGCILGIKNLHPSHNVTIERANTKVGWSCPACDDLSLLLSEDELESIVQMFDEEIGPKGDQISFEDFLAFKSLQHNVTEEDHDRLRLEFQLVDTDSNGMIDWWEFLNYQSKMKLFSRSQEDLVDLLTVKEMEIAQSAFSRLKPNKRGRVSPRETRRLLSEWYRLLDTSTAGEKEDVFDQYARLATTRVMTLDYTPLGSVSWKDFLMGQAKYIIGARPNMIKF